MSTVETEPREPLTSHLHSPAMYFCREIFWIMLWGSTSRRPGRNSHFSMASARQSTIPLQDNKGHTKSGNSGLRDVTSTCVCFQRYKEIIVNITSVYFATPVAKSVKPLAVNPKVRVSDPNIFLYLVVPKSLHKKEVNGLMNLKASLDGFRKAFKQDWPSWCVSLLQNSEKTYILTNLDTITFWTNKIIFLI